MMYQLVSDCEPHEGMWMHAIDPAPATGTEVRSTPAQHAQRSAVRRLIAGLFDSWDEGDGQGFVAHFAPGGCWRDAAGVTTPHAGLGARFTQWRAWEPWSLHWLSNESVVSDDHGVEGRWLWSAASTVHQGSEAAWSGGDLTLEVVRHEGSWLIKDLDMSHRYCSPYADGWLTTPMMRLDIPGGPPAAGEAGSAGPATTQGDGPADLEALGAERDLRALMWSFIDDQEEGKQPYEIAAHFAGDGSFEQVGTDLSRISDVGRDAITRAFEEERHRETAVMRILCSESIAVDGHVASCRWRDLWTAVRDGEAHWVSHRYEVGATVEDGAWRIRRMIRSRVLDCPYDEGWLHGARVAH
jgi:hypothetical protein